jgi:hypothetical protein
MLGCHEPGSAVIPSRSTNLKRKLPYTWELVRVGSTWVGINTMRPNHIVEEGILDGRVPEIASYDQLQREVRYGTNSRIDLFLSNDGAPRYCCWALRRLASCWSSCVLCSGRPHPSGVETSRGVCLRGRPCPNASREPCQLRRPRPRRIDRGASPRQRRRPGLFDRVLAVFAEAISPAWSGRIVSSGPILRSLKVLGPTDPHRNKVPPVGKTVPYPGCQGPARRVCFRLLDK